MNEQGYIEKLSLLWPRAGEASAEAIRLADEAVGEQPGSAKLWCMRGNLIELGPESCPYKLDEALNCYLRAVEVNPTFAEAYEEAGHFYDNVPGQRDKARSFFQRAKELRKE
ncbi:MAG TPA: tetratricopeptide repeat protein [Pyrinomonadaceae bacterium]|jgi:tetratricopeptide (TPR) repeat protein|nr:tetratricopeptide repeat protein [Pyrinomonadaceae bacterium]